MSDQETGDVYENIATCAQATVNYVDQVVRLLQCYYSTDVTEEHKEKLGTLIDCVVSRALFDLTPMHTLERGNAGAVH